MLLKVVIIIQVKGLMQPLLPWDLECLSFSREKLKLAEA